MLLKQGSTWRGHAIEIGVVVIWLGTLSIGSVTEAGDRTVSLIPLSQERCVCHSGVYTWREPPPGGCSHDREQQCAEGFERFDESVGWNCGWVEQTSEILENGIVAESYQAQAWWFDNWDDCDSGGHTRLMVEFELPQPCVVDIEADTYSGGGGRHNEFSYDLSLHVRALCPDLDGDSMIGFSDVIAVLTAWGSYDCPPYRIEDLDEDCDVDLEDLLAVLASWGPCEVSGAVIDGGRVVRAGSFSCDECVRLWGPQGELLFDLGGSGYHEDSATIQASPGVYVLEAVGMEWAPCRHFSCGGGGCDGEGLLAVEEYDGGDDAQNWIDNGYTDLTTYRIYAEFDGSGDDGVLSVFGIAGLPLSITSSDDWFYNDTTFGTNTAPKDFRPAMIWTAEWDTYVTIGVDHDDGSPTNLSPGFDEVTNGLSESFTSENVGWFVTPDDDDSYADADGRVLLGQFTVAEGTGFGGVLNVLDRENTQREQMAYNCGLSPHTDSPRTGTRVIEANEFKSDRPCPGDADGTGTVDFADILTILTAWGDPGGPKDLDHSGTVDFGDILVVLAEWGPCP